MKSSEQASYIDKLFKFSKEEFEKFVDYGQYTDQDVIDLWTEAVAEKERADKLEERNKALMAVIVADAKGTFSCLSEEREKKLREAIEKYLKEGMYQDQGETFFETILASLYPDKEEEA